MLKKITETTKKEVIKTFLNFLKENKCYKEYFKEVKARHASELDTLEKRANIFKIPILDRCVNDNDFNFLYGFGNLINYAFSWAATEQGYNYWLAINEKWKELVKSKYQYQDVHHKQDISILYLTVSNLD